MKDPHLADDMRGFIGQEAMHADVHEQVLYEYMVVNGIDPKPILDQVEFVFEKTLGPNDFHRSQAAAKSSVRSAVADRGDRALHRRDG